MVQITDPHLGPWQPVHRLHRRIAELLDHEPDLVLLTGDFLTMEGNGTPGCAGRARSRRCSALPGRCFAIFGNHDHEAPEEVRARPRRERRRACWSTRRRVVDTPAGPVQIVGADWYARGPRGAPPERCSRASRAGAATCACCCSTTRSASTTCRTATST